MDLLISAGEASGDLHGSRLLKALQRARPLLSSFGMGGSRLQDAGLERIVPSESLSVFGVAEVFAKLPGLRRALSVLDAAARARRPSAAILIDFPDFNGLLARRLRRRGVPLIYYVSPQVWAWRRYRARRIAESARRIITLFPFEAEIFRRLGGDAVCAGHPLVEDVREGLARPSPLPEKTRRRLVLLPGSRDTEIERHWPTLTAAAAELATRFDLEVVVVRAASVPRGSLERTEAREFRVVDSGVHPILASADLALVASGTATLEAALCGTPMVVFYRTSPFTWAIARALVRLKWASLVNIVAGEGVVPELIQDDFTLDRMVSAGAEILERPERAAAMRAGLARVADLLGPPGASSRAADLVLSALESHP